jgi:hypothetical protein
MVIGSQSESPRELVGGLPPNRPGLLKAALLTVMGLALLQWPVTAGQPPGVPGELYPKGDVFCFTFYSTSEKDSAYALKNGATAIGPFYGNQAGALRLAEQLNTRLLYQVRPPAMAGWRPGNKDFVWPSDETICQQTAAIVQAVQTNRHIAMWDIEPEELRAWLPAELHYLTLLASVIRSNDPNRRPMFMYEPNHRDAATLARTVPCQDVCAKGSYPDVLDNGLFAHERIWIRWSMEQELGAIASANPAAQPWLVLWMAGDPAPGESGLIRDRCRHDAYLGLVLGGKGVQVWSGARARRGFSSESFQAYFDGYLSVARDLNGPLHLAPVFLFGQKRLGPGMSITAGPASLQLVYQGTNSYPSVAWLCAAYRGADYLFVVNSAEQAVTVAFSGWPAVDREDLFAGGSAPTPGGSFSLTLPPLAVKAFRFGAGVLPALSSDSQTATNTPQHTPAAKPASGPRPARVQTTKPQPNENS